MFTVSKPMSDLETQSMESGTGVGNDSLIGNKVTGLTKKIFFDDLPNEIKAHIVKQLHPDDQAIGRFKQTSKTNRELGEKFGHASGFEFECTLQKLKEDFESDPERCYKSNYDLLSGFAKDKKFIEFKKLISVLSFFSKETPAFDFNKLSDSDGKNILYCKHIYNSIEDEKGKKTAPGILEYILDRKDDLRLDTKCIHEIEDCWDIRSSTLLVKKIGEMSCADLKSLIDHGADPHIKAEFISPWHDPLLGPINRVEEDYKGELSIYSQLLRSDYNRDIVDKIRVLNALSVDPGEIREPVTYMFFEATHRPEGEFMIPDSHHSIEEIRRHKLEKIEFRLEVIRALLENKKVGGEFKKALLHYEEAFSADQLWIKTEIAMDAAFEARRAMKPVSPSES